RLAGVKHRLLCALIVKLERRVVVAMPGQDRDRTAMRPPAFRHLSRQLLARPLLEGQDARQARLYGEVSGGPDVRAPFCEQKVDLRRPPPDALDPDQLRDGLLVVSGQVRQVELAAYHQFAQRARIALLLARQTAGA